jgi:hypothetical protein
MKYYVYRPDANHFNGVALDGENSNVVKIRNIDHPILKSWTPVVVHDFEDDPGVEGDFPALSNYDELPVMSQRAWDALYSLIGPSCEALPVVHPSRQPYFIVHVLETVDCLDVGQSVVERYGDGGIMQIVRYSFKLEKIHGQHIFKLPMESGGELIVDEEFQRAVEANGLKGLLFEQLPMVI